MHVYIHTMFRVPVEEALLKLWVLHTCMYNKYLYICIYTYKCVCVCVCTGSSADITHTCMYT